MQLIIDANRNAIKDWGYVTSKVSTSIPGYQDAPGGLDSHVMDMSEIEIKHC